ncbi:Retrovirus-related Pol polyprotein from transposon TNT 1-94 [Phytophthora rubi]|uniref:Retrovirus-related Pol polyprotein from transposon TNT 1-94 n=1 Tax=Phytophthora rubi TaxID=129364 RepID=A0A6A4EZF4_9STRA|nr:Retrovirus-related Pol polyprotein from transposon TNT 1-94 [Phytophthora rubi]
MLYIPDLRKNLISVTQLAQKGVQFDFHSVPGKVTLTRGALSLTSESLNGVCVLKVINKSQLALYVFPELTYDLVHRRFGHASPSIMDQMMRRKLVTGLRVNTLAKGHQGLCDACQLGTKRRGSFPAAPRLDVVECNSGVHSDICGPIEIPSLNGKRYVLLFVDSFSRYCHIYLLARRSEFFKCVEEHKAAIENKHNRSLRKFTSDNAGEYLSDEFLDFCARHGIDRGTTVPYTPEQNGLAEVRFRILFNKVRTVLVDSNSPKQLWAEALQVVVYLQNRTMNTTTRRTPFEAWYGFVPDVSHLRVFGSLAYVYLPRKTLSTSGAPGGAATRTAKRQKLDYRAVRGIFVGYASHQKAWKILDCASGTVVTSCHVSFDESFSPAAEELRRQEFRLLSSHLALDFNYYARSATSEADLLFYSHLDPAEKSSADDVALLEDFVNSFDMSEVNFADVRPFLREYDPVACAVIDGIAPQVSTKRPPARNPVLNVVRKQQEAATLVALENVHAKSDMCLVSALGIAADPQTYDRAVSGPDACHWRGAINNEAASLKTNGTWTLMPLPSGKRALSCRWLFKKKYNSDGSIERYKARLVVIGCQQVKYRDFDEIFAPVIRLESLRVLLAIACIEDLEVHQMDIETAFLNGTLNEEVYMTQPQGMMTAGKQEWVCKLHKSLYGLKQAPRAWHQALTSYLTQEGFEKLSCESCIYIRRCRGELEIVAIYVDNLLLLSKSFGVMEKLKQSIGSAFKANDLGEVSFLLGLKITRDRRARKLWINQQSNVDSILQKFNMEHGAGVATPTAAGKKLTKQQAPATEEATAKMLKKPFRQAVGSLMYQMIGSRPDMAFAIQDTSRFLSNYGEAHWQAVKRCIRYLKATRNYGLEFSGNAVVLRAYTDSDYAGCEDDRRSVSGYVTMIGNCTVTWSSRKQRIVAQSTAEAEYVALAHCTREVLFLRQLLKELGYEQAATVINEDNQACIAIAENPAQHSRVKHIDVRYHFIREHVQHKDVNLQYVVSKDNVADALTKGLPRDQLEYLREAMNVKSMG